jgi:hypothetical protein
MGRHHQQRGIVAENQKLNESDHRTLEMIVSKNHRTAAAKIPAELSIHLDESVSTKTIRCFTHPTSMVHLQLLNF